MNKQNYGCIKSPTDLRNYRACSSIKVDELPERFELPHASIKDQGKVQCCVACAIASALETHYHTKFSTAWIYGYRPDNYYQGIGMATNNAIGTIYKVGCLKEEYLDANVEMPEAKAIVDKDIEKYKEKASEIKIKGYCWGKTIEELKQLMYQTKDTLVIAIDLGEKNKELELDENYVVKIPEKRCGSHAVMCYGWNEKGLLIQNSWGEKWGNKGCCILPYDYGIYELWFMLYDDKKNEKQIIEKPKVYWLRELIMMIIKIIRKWKGGK